MKFLLDHAVSFGEQLETFEYIYSLTEEEGDRLQLIKHASKKRLNNKGVVVSKVFMGEEFEEIKNEAKKNFKKIHFFKPNSSRQESRETYIHCSELST